LFYLYKFNYKIPFLPEKITKKIHVAHLLFALSFATHLNQ